MTPTKQQELIIKSDSSAVVIAAPGSGKTFVVSQMIKRNLRDLLDHQGVIAISYTNKASNELKSRSLSKGEKPKSSFFGTIDKFNLSEILIPFGKQLFGLPRNDIKIIKTSSLTEAEQAELEWLSRTVEINGVDEINVLKNHFLNGNILIESIGVLSNYIFRSSLACRKYIKARYKYIYIDEYQDSGLPQHQMFLQIIDLGIIGTAVGDINQSIYAFSGKDSKFLTELTDSPSFKYYPLDKNHRCHPSIINYSNYFLNPKAELIPTDVNQILFCRVKGDESSIAKWIDKNIEWFKNELEIETLGKIAILTKNNRTAEIINRNLITPHHHFVSTELDINLNIWSAIFSSLLSYLFNPAHKFIDVIEIFTSYDKFSQRDLRSLKTHKENLTTLISNPVFDPEKIKNTFIKIAHVIAPQLKSEESIGLLREVLRDSALLDTYKKGGDDELHILTIHKSKGLEYDFVIHLDLYEWILPRMAPGANDDFDNPIFPELDQDRNLHYVALTRSRKWCLLISSTKRTNSRGATSKGVDSKFLWDNDIEKLRYKSKN